MPEVMHIEVDEDFDPRPKEAPFSLRDPEGNPNWPIIGGIALAIVLVLAIIIVLVNPFGSKEEVVQRSEWTPSDPTIAVNFLDTYPVDDPMVKSIQDSFDALAEFLATGDIEVVQSTFDLAGRQYALLVEEQPKIAANPDTEGPAVVRLGPVGKVSQVDNTFVVRVVIRWTIPGKEGQDLEYDLTMLRENNNTYLLSVISETNPIEPKPISFCTAADVIAGLDPFETVAKELESFSTSDQIALTLEVIDIRLKAWNLMKTATSGTSDRENVDAIIDEYSKVQGEADAAATYEELFVRQDFDRLTSNQKIMQDRVRSQCDGLDISDR